MAEAPDQTRREIEETRQRIARAAEELEERIERTTNWRKLVADYPIESVAVVAAAGFVVSALILPGIIAAVRRPTRERPGGGLLSWIRPIVVPIVTARIIDYMRKR